MQKNKTPLVVPSSSSHQIDRINYRTQSKSQSMTSSTVRPATPSDLPSLSTIVPRSFHPTNPYIRNLFPDTPLLRQWWTDIWTAKCQTPETSHLLTVEESLNPNPNPNSANNNHISTTTPPKSLGILSLQLFTPSQTGAGLYTTFAPTPDHDAEAYHDVASSLASARESLMTGTAHFVIELFGVDHEAKGLGLGKGLLLRACAIADEAGLPIFVMANASAKGIYVKCGFEVRDVKVLPGDYKEFMLVKPAAVERERGLSLST
jgi:GNAT superfamily N-acetyltransferase